MSSALKTALSRAASPGRLIPRPSGRPPAWVAAAAMKRGISSSKRDAAADEQAQPLGLYYEILLDEPPPYGSAGRPKPAGSRASAPAEAKPSRPPAPEPGLEAAQQQQQQETSPPSSPPPSPSAPAGSSSEPEAPKPAGGIVFGSSLAGPAQRAERLAALRSQSTMVAGVLVPPKPDEPDNCCMSGCVNCVWDRYREEMEEWASASAEAGRRLLERKQPGAAVTGVEAAEAKAAASKPPGPGPGVAGAGAVSMDDDGGGSDTNWAPAKKSPKIAKDLWDDELYNNVPVGIREFMKQEKKLKEKHRLEGTSGG